MRTLFIKDYGSKLSVHNYQFKLTRPGKDPLFISPVDIDEIIIDSRGVNITSAALYLAGDSGIPVYFLKRNKPSNVLAPVYPVMTVDKRRALYKAYDSRTGLYIARGLVRAKILNQATVIMLLNKYITDTPEYKDPKTIITILRRKAEQAGLTEWRNGEWRNKLMHVEAEAARHYWSSIAIIMPNEIGFNGRDPDSSDAFNASLNYLYAILYSRCYSALIYAGLDPYAGLLHTDKSGKESLVYDYSDPFKPIIDYHLVRFFLSGNRINIEEGLITDESRKKLLILLSKITSLNIKLGKEKQSWTKFEDAIRTLAHTLGKSLLIGDLGEHFVFRW